MTIILTKASAEQNFLILLFSFFVEVRSSFEVMGVAAPFFLYLGCLWVRLRIGGLRLWLQFFIRSRNFVALLVFLGIHHSFTTFC